MLISRSFALLIFLVACGGKVDSGLGDSGADAAPPKPDSGPEPAPSADASPPTGECTNLDLVGQPTTIEQVAESAPPFAATGGPISTGIYQLTSMTVFTGPNGSSGNAGSIDARIRVTSAKNGWNIEAVAALNQEAEQRTASTATTPATGELDLTTYCPNASPATTAAYSFDGVNLTISVSDSEEQFTLVTK